MEMKYCASAMLLVVVAGCAAMHESPEFERHRMSDIVVPYDRTDVFYFDTTINPQYPDNDPAAEAARMEWLEGWLEFRKMCPSGYEIVKRREFDYMENNPARRDLRYEVKCTVAPASS